MDVQGQAHYWFLLHNLPGKNYSIVLTTLICERCCWFHVGYILYDLGEEGFTVQGKGSVKCKCHAGTKGYSHLYTHCQNQNVVLVTGVFIPICRLPLREHTYQRLGFQSCAGRTLFGPRSWAKMEPGNITVKIWFWCLFFLFCSTQGTNTASTCIFWLSSHSYLGHLYWLYSFKQCVYIYIYIRCQGFHVDIGLHVCR